MSNSRSISKQILKMEIDNITATENITNFVYQSIPRGEVLPLSVVTDPEIKRGYTHTLAIDKYDFPNFLAAESQVKVLYSLPLYDERRM